MIVTPFHHPPRFVFLMRMLVPSGGVFLLSFLFMGQTALSPGVQLSTRRPSAIESSKVVVSGNAAKAGVLHWAQMIDDWKNVPEVCWGNRAVTDFHRSQCSLFWNKLALTSAIGLIPLGGVLIFLMLGLDLLAAFYRKVRKKIETQSDVKIGIVTDPPSAPSDLFSWFYCLRTVSVETGPGKQEKVYIPFSQPMPLPGQNLAIYEWGKCFGEMRLAAHLYAPHVVIFSAKR